MQRTKKTTLFLISGAVLVAGLFLFERKPSALDTKNLEPDQLNFSESNKIKESSSAAESKAAEAVASAAQSNVASSPKLESALAKLQAKDIKAWQTFEEILKSKNDNDPRLDQDLKHQSPEVRAALMVKYETIPAEARNDRGLIAYMIARDFESPADMQFLKKVFEEPPCLSLSDCKSVAPEDPHHSSENQTTQNYPQLATLFQLERRLTEHPELLKDAAYRDGAASTLRQAESFPVPVVSNKAQQIRNKFQL